MRGNTIIHARNASLWDSQLMTTPSIITHSTKWVPLSITILFPGITKYRVFFTLGICWLCYLFPVCNVNPHASQMDEYKHACTDCSFKCTNKHDLKVTTFASKELQKQDKLNPLICVQIHYSEMHSKQRQRFFACPMCDHKSNDVNNMKRHINTVHHSDARRVYRYIK